MGFLDKLKNKAQQSKGRGKEAAGRAADDPYLEAEGRKDRAAGGAKQVGEKAKDAAREIRRSTER
ncbi:CsbD family protein [Spirillospora sp. NPDC052269]